MQWACVDPGYFLSRACSEGQLTSLHHTRNACDSSNGKRRKEDEKELVFMPCRSRISFATPVAKRTLPKPDDAEKPNGWTVNRYCQHVLDPDSMDRIGNHFVRPDAEHHHVDQPHNWKVKRYAGPQVARYVKDPYSDMIRPSRAPSVQKAKDQEWMKATGRSAPKAPEKESATDVPDGWNVPRYSAQFTRLASGQCSLSAQSNGSKVGGVSHGAPKERYEKKITSNNPFLEMKAAAIAADKKRAEAAGDGVDNPAGWTVNRYGTNLPGTGMTADQLMQADPLGRASVTANLWWGVPKAQAAQAAVKHAGFEGVSAAARENRGLPSRAKAPF